jgi:uncharacterized protein YycO
MNPKNKGRNLRGFFIIPAFLILSFIIIGTGCTKENAITAYNENSVNVKLQSEHTDIVDKMTIKDALNSDDYHMIFDKLSREDRTRVLTDRDWQEWVISENSYLEMFNNDTTLGIKDKVPPKALVDSIIRECEEKEECMPFSDIKSGEKWIPPEKDTKSYFTYCDKLNKGRDMKNNCNFSIRTPGDVVVLHGGTALPVLGHAAIVVKGNTSNTDAIVSAYTNTGVLYQNMKYYNDYFDWAALLGIHTWPYNGPATRTKAVNYAKSKVGKPYGNWLNKWDQNRFYCSSIAWAAYFWTSPWYARLDLDDERTPQWVAPDELLLSPRTYGKSVSW